MTYIYKSRRVSELNVLLNVVEHDTETLYHGHDYLELAYVLEGKAEHTVDDVVTTISRGNYFIIDYGMKHKYKRIGTGTFRIMNCLFSPMVIDPSLKHCRRFQDLITHYLININIHNLIFNPTTHLYTDKNGEILRLLKRIQVEYDSKKIGYQEVIRGQFIELMITIIRSISISDADFLDNHMIPYTIRYVQKHYAEKISLSVIADKYNYSLANASRIFKNQTGLSFQKYVQDIRAKESCRLLVSTNKSIQEIAELVGYSDMKYFHQMFKQQIGTTPSMYRKLHR